MKTIGIKISDIGDVAIEKVISLFTKMKFGNISFARVNLKESSNKKILREGQVYFTNFNNNDVVNRLLTIFEDDKSVFVVFDKGLMWECSSIQYDDQQFLKCGESITLRSGRRLMTPFTHTYDNTKFLIPSNDTTHNENCVQSINGI